MGRFILFLLLILAIYIVWRAFGPSSWQRTVSTANPPREIKGPDDDEAFLWELEKKRFKQRRAEELAAQEEAERIKRAKQRRMDGDNPEDI
ncbi:hypothetical protein N7326_03885 [Corynebacterium sp. ES2794-CONJ1]|uniref:hypothetical protein n=1 Tax=unclassified Corynebacterium TaxID=2624378 RepID=UPI00216A0AFF|nr:MULTISPECIES: hypothetical protein [unclassified Corynebacterium]MCS4489705.1 hypothetical protein [Corynebacterium sp. ES2775-CONJ]MCS4491286.1 hypothetical protein [Corynebacterium sp. ES2715-CONJ3]MCS4531617.1 hypothetical protein [Corynebacterium sp. ES2730-CONJ]MCU9519013.1 hypothetical protein [Corynebacterium sp. ES2794-CONJ1]